ncbi:multicomponent Na+:H+ antiporter subunit D [Halalkaliarchaeum desulfuricum]|uniref:Multicomponent Na+:H+ antiporter subunit D n=1 Tax=Halalkaliarchaeum desulfuricum TaxID=2055893 RepID=A0A343TIS8_9EURY|nr:monovalent cation/H+ antiporter subunit D family protein [Halalkaliarchaeum desulfuricum]AUX09000.1 multicomponent Na+:H+ antiporter subunit D [Halalkaliarchaeum desulfuricum]
MTDVLLPLLVAVPILAAVLPLAFGLRFENVGWPVAAATTFGMLVVAAGAAWEVFTEGPLYHELGGFPRPVGIELVGDELSTLVVLLVAVVSFTVVLYARTAGPRGNPFYSGYLLLIGGLMGVSLTGDLFNMFVFLEIVGLTTYALVAADRSGEAAYAALKYLFIGTVGASLYLIGVGYAFLATGTLNMIDLQTALADAGYTNTLVRAAFGFIVAGFAIKIALFPVHTWQPDAYQQAPDSVSALISALVSTVAAYALIRVVYTVFTIDFLAANPAITDGVLLLATVSILAGSALAVTQSEIKRMLAYSSVAQFGMIAAAVLIANDTALTGAIIHLIGHGLMKGALFMGAGVLAAAYGVRTLHEYAGLSAKAPYTAGAISVLGLALVGIPPSIGFLGKWYIALGAIEGGHWVVAGVVFLSTLLTLAYVARLLEKFYFTPSGVEHLGGVEPVEPGAPATDGGSTPEHDGENDDGHGSEHVPPAVPVPVNRRPGVSAVMVLLVVLAAVGVVALGFGGSVFESLIDPFVGRVL